MPPLALAALAYVALSLSPEYLATESPGGIPRWIPLGVSAVLWAVALRSMIAVWPFPAVALTWALGSAAYARPALRDLVGWDVRLEPLILLAAVALAVAGLRGGLRGLPRWAALSAAGLVLVLAVDVLFPVLPAIDAGAYVLTLIVACITLRAASIQRSFER